MISWLRKEEGGFTMRRVFCYVCFILSTMILCFFCSSCNKDENKKTNVVIIAGIHSNSKIMNVRSDKIKKIFSNLGEIRLIISDGKPELAVGENEKYIGEYNEQYIQKSRKVKETNRNIWERDYLSEQVQSFIEEYKKLKPKYSEVDTLGAIIKAVDLLNMFSQNEDEKDKGNKEIIIYDTGLSTCGGIDFRKNEWKDLLFCDKELKSNRLQTMIESLRTKNMIPDLSGIKVTWYGIGQTAEPQPELKQNLDNLKKIWWSILKAAQAIPPSKKVKYDYFYEIESHGKTSYSKNVTVISSRRKKNSKMGESQCRGILSAELGFKRESSEFISEKETMDILKPYAKCILRNPNENILIVGTTADPIREGGSILLSEKTSIRFLEIFQKFY